VFVLGSLTDAGLGVLRQLEAGPAAAPVAAVVVRAELRAAAVQRLTLVHIYMQTVYTTLVTNATSQKHEVQPLVD